MATKNSQTVALKMQAKEDMDRIVSKINTVIELLGEADEWHPESDGQNALRKAALIMLKDIPEWIKECSDFSE